MAKSKRADSAEVAQAAKMLADLWASVRMEAEAHPDISYVDDPAVRSAIKTSINHKLVLYRYCLPVQLTGKLFKPSRDCLALQRGKEEDDTTLWDARSFASKVIAPFIRREEDVLGTADPYVGNAARIPRMMRNDPSKKDIPGWNVLIDVLESVQTADDPNVTEAALKQALLEIHRRQQDLRFTYPVPPRVSLATVLDLSRRFVAERSGGDRAMALAGALFDVIGIHFRLFAQVNRARINASDEASGQAADLECVDESGAIVIAVEVKDRALKLADVEGTITKTRHREIRDVFFTAPKIDALEKAQIDSRIETAFAGGQNLYCADFFDLARAVLALGGERIRVLFLRKVGEHLDKWNTQPSNRQAWKRLLESI
jgi:SacI restriction endonuclease